SIAAFLWKNYTSSFLWNLLEQAKQPQHRHLLERCLVSNTDRLFSNLLELNASDERGIDVVRTQIKAFAESGSIFRKESVPILKLVIMDEADSMTNAAQDALRRGIFFITAVIEKHVRHVRFCFICNDISKISPAIQSRCLLCRFSPLAKPQMLAHLNHVITSEGH
ncbi:unnamed protein product, partial [Sphagnum compactum]